jgi:hypothetical protein
VPQNLRRSPDLRKLGIREVRMLAGVRRRTGRSMWVPNWSSTSCDLGVFVYQAVEQVAYVRREAGMAMQVVVVTSMVLLG